MKIRITKDRTTNNASLVDVKRADLTEMQERTYKFAEKALKNGTDLLKIEARSRLAVNGLSFSDIYHELDK